MQVRVSPTEHGTITGRAEKAAQERSAFMRDAALGVLIEVAFPPAAFDCAEALTAIGASLSRAVAEADAGRPISIDPAELRRVVAIVEAAGLVAIGVAARP